MSLLQIHDYPFDEDQVQASIEDRLPRIRVYRLPDTVVVLGRGSKPETELHLDVCKKDAIPIMRRRGGGCAVLIDPGNVIISVTLPVLGIGENQAHFQKLSAWVLRALKDLGVGGAYQDGISDLVIGGRKIGGACIYRTRGLLFYSIALLVEPRIDLMELYLKHPPREPEYRRGRSHALFVGSLKPHLADKSIDQFYSELIAQLKLEDIQ